MAIPESVLDDLRSKHRRICVLPFEAADVVIRAPTRAEYKVTRAMAHDPARVADSQEDLMRKLVVYVNGECGAWTDVVAKFDDLLDIFPGLCEHPAASRAVRQFTGMEAGEMGKGSPPPASINGSIPRPLPKA